MNEMKRAINSLVLLAALWLSGCTWLPASGLTPTAAAAPSPFATSTPGATATAQPFPSPMPTGASVPISTNPVHQLWLRNHSPSWLLLDQTHLYWIDDEEGYHLYRYPLAGDRPPEIIATSRFVNDDNSPSRHGVLGVIRPVLTGDSLFYLDTPYPAVNPVWDLHALNLAQGVDTVLLRGDNVRFTPYFTAQGNWLALSTGELTSDPGCDGDDTIVLIYNLQTHEQRELDRSCTHRLWVWGEPHLNGDVLTVEQ